MFSSMLSFMHLNHFDGEGVMSMSLLPPVVALCETTGTLEVRDDPSYGSAFSSHSATGVFGETGIPETSAFHLVTKSFTDEIKGNLMETEVLFHSWFLRDKIILPFSQENC